MIREITPIDPDEYAKTLFVMEAYHGICSFLGIKIEEVDNGRSDELYDFVEAVSEAVRNVRYTDEWIENRRHFQFLSRNDAAVFFTWLGLKDATSLVVGGKSIPAHICFFALAIDTHSDAEGFASFALAVTMGVEFDPNQRGPKEALRMALSQNGRNGGLAGKARRDKVASHALSLARGGNWKSADAAATDIRSMVNEYSRRLGGGDYTHRKVADWLRRAGFKQGGNVSSSG